MEVSSGSYDPPLVYVRLNGTGVGELDFPGPGLPPRTLTLIFPGVLLRQGYYNEIEFTIPGAVSHNPRDPRMLGLTCVEMTIRALD